MNSLIRSNDLLRVRFAVEAATRQAQRVYRPMSTAIRASMPEGYAQRMEAAPLFPAVAK